MERVGGPRLAAGGLLEDMAEGDMDWNDQVRLAADAVDEWLVPRVAEDERPEAASVIWSAKDLLGHLAAWSDLLLDEIEALRQDRPQTIEAVDVDAWNAIQVARRRGWAPDQVIAEWRHSVQRAETVIASLSPATLERRWSVTWARESVSIGDLVRLWLGHLEGHRSRNEAP
jgi:uncharacterized damage-inducible protein DinB